MHCHIASTCRSCGSSHLRDILSLGSLPVADRLISADEYGKDIERYPLTLTWCGDCSLVQIRETLPPEELFSSEYPYHSSFSDSLLAHSRTHAEELIRSERLTQHSQVIELASNDGYMLQHFAHRGMSVLGVDPAESPVRIARQRGIPTEHTFFTRALAEQWQSSGRQADVVIANNILAHVADTNGFVAGIKAILKPGGVVTIEVPYVADLIASCEFDTIYHQHLCYFSLMSLEHLITRASLTIHNVERIAIHGGSLRLFVSHDRLREDSVNRLLDQEHACGVGTYGYYRNFASNVRDLCGELRSTLLALADSPTRIAAYGAAAKGTTLLGMLDLPDGLVQYVVDRNVHKHGRHMPVGRIPIDPIARLQTDVPDYCLLLAWNFRDEILRQQAAYRNAGGRFIVPIPAVQVV